MNYKTMYNEIVRAIKINKKNTRQYGRHIMSNESIKFLEKDYDELRNFIRKLFKDYNEGID